VTDRATLHSIARLVPAGSRVLDLGCGDGALLDHLQRERGCTGYGIELADENVLACVKRGVNVIQLNLDQGLTIFDDDSFDVVLQIDTLQHLRNAETMLRETAPSRTSRCWPPRTGWSSSMPSGCRTAASAGCCRISPRAPRSSNSSADRLR
jgi:SAM-dependent methyltransferase